MANDRIRMTCRHCGSERTLAKYYPEMAHGIFDPDAVCEWVEKHMECSPAFGTMDLNGDRCFDLSTESEKCEVEEVEGI